MTTQKSQLQNLAQSILKNIEGPLTQSKIEYIYAQITGSKDAYTAALILYSILRGMPGKESALNYVTSLLYQLKPGHILDALILGQGLALQEFGKKFLQEADIEKKISHKTKLAHAGARCLEVSTLSMKTYQQLKRVPHKPVKVEYHSLKPPGVVFQKKRSSH